MIRLNAYQFAQRIAIAFCVALGSLPALTVSADTPTSNDPFRHITARMQQFVDAHEISGCVTLVMHEGQVVHHASVGMADVQAKRAMQRDSIFRIASMTKPVTATALLMLQDEQKLSVDDPVSKYLPAFRNIQIRDGAVARPVTIRDIMTHTAGLVGGPRDRAGELSLHDIADAIGTAELEFEPGSRWKYSSGMTVAGRIIEVVSGQSYASFLQDRIFDPVKMSDTRFQLDEQQAARLAVTYRPGKRPGTLEVTDHEFASSNPTSARTPNPSGGLFSTAADMGRFYQMILDSGTVSGQRLVSAEAIKQMTSIHTGDLTTGFTPGNGWGLGWCVVQTPQHVTAMLSPGTYGHGGAFGTQGWVDPQRRAVFVLMIQRTGFGNSDGSDIRQAFQELAVRAIEPVETPGAAFVDFFGYQHAIELRNETTRAVLCPHAGGRVLEYSLSGKNALYLDDSEQGWTWSPGKMSGMSAGRFDIGPEKVIPRRHKLWAGSWTGVLTGPRSARLTSMFDEATGVQLVRDFVLADGSSHLSCTQTIVNVSRNPTEWCHWSRTFAQGNGICVIPLTKPSRFPKSYVMYETGDLINIAPDDPAIRQRDDYLEILDVPEFPKLGFDSQAGWLAYFSPNHLLFVKQFRTFPDRVYNEAAGLTISVWYPEDRRVELEPIGPRERLQPGESGSFTEHWWLLQEAFPQDNKRVDLNKLRETVDALRS